MPGSVPKRKFPPDAICLAPNPKEVASPNKVATTAIMSIISPRQPKIFLPNTGKKIERSEKGKFLLNE